MRLLLAIAALIAAVVALRPGATNPNEITSLPGLTFPINFTMSAPRIFCMHPAHADLGTLATSR